MKINEFLEKYAEYRHLFEIVSEPSNSENKLLDNQLSKEDYKYWHDRFLEYGGKIEDLIKE